nr:hypothetical protein Iba_chr02fCG11910 [Ipomoea batatas]
MVLLQCRTASWIELSESQDRRQLSTEEVAPLVLVETTPENSYLFLSSALELLRPYANPNLRSFTQIGLITSKYLRKIRLDNRRHLFSGAQRISPSDERT